MKGGNNYTSNSSDCTNVNIIFIPSHPICLASLQVKVLNFYMPGLPMFTVKAECLNNVHENVKRSKKVSVGYLYRSYLVVEEASALLHKGDPKLLSRLEDRNVVLAAARGSNVLDAGTSRAIDVVGEGELYV